MLYDRRLDTFISCASAGSFSKAADSLFMMPTAVMKQIKQLESDLDLQLFIRTHQGLILTPEGRQLLKETKQLKEWCEKAVERIQNASENEPAVVRIGTSVLTPPSLLADFWPKIQPLVPNLSFRLIPFENKPEVGKEILANLGKDIDVVLGFFDETLLKLRQCDGLVLNSCPFCIGVPFGHPLYNKRELNMEDLKNQTLLTIHKGWSKGSDAILEDLNATIPGLKLQEFSYFRTDELSQAVNEQKLILTFPLWKNAHPLLKILPVNWDYSIQYGFMHNHKPSATVQKFLNAVQLVQEKKI